MKKRLSLLLALLLTVSLMLPVQALADSYPLIYLNKSDSSATIFAGGTGKLVFSIFPEYPTYVNERANVKLYNAGGTLVGAAQHSFYNTSDDYKTYTVTINTASLNLTVGTYTAVYWMEYKTLEEWVQAPTQSIYRFKVIDDICNGDHDYMLTYTYVDATCVENGEAQFTCRNCGSIIVDETPLSEEHDYGEPEITVNPTPDSEGELLYTCGDCGGTKTEVIPTSAAVKITSQPESVTVSADETASFTVEATGDGLTYQWYYKNADSTEWKEASGTDATYSIKNSVERNGREFYCIVTDQYGNTEQSETVTMLLPVAKITKQPSDASALEGEKAKISLKATGDGLTYQWYYSTNGGDTWKEAASTTSSYSLTMTEARDNRLMKCIVTDAYGNTAESDVVTLTTIYKAKITVQPADAAAYEGEKATTFLEATGEGLTYQWYYKNPGSEEFKKSSIVKAKCAVTMTEDRDGREMYCVVTDEYGNTAQSDTVTLTMMNKATITKQPKNAWAYEGEKAKISLTATGDGITYQWYYSTNGGETWKEAASTTSSYSLTMTAARDNRLMKCAVTDEYGNSVESDVVTLDTRFKATITKQPSDAKAYEGEKATTKIVATGDGITYQWYYKNPGSEEFKESSIVTAKCAVTMTEARDGREMYCIVTDKYGNTAQSDTVTLSIRQDAKITKQPKNAWAYEDEKAKISLKATGDGITYQWYYSTNGGETWKEAASTTSSYSLTMTAARDNRLMKCVVTDEYGNSVESNVVTLDTRFKATITKQPSNASAYEGEKATTKIAATGDGITYQWYYRNPGSEEFKPSSIVSAKCAVTMKEARDGREMYCIVTDQYGNTAQSRTITLTMRSELKITSQPKSVTAEEGEKAKFTVKATGDGLTYQWYYKSPTATEYKECSGTEATYTLGATAARDGRMLYCVITDQYGSSVKTKVVTLTVE